MTDPILITGGATRLGLALAEYYLTVGQQVVITIEVKTTSRATD